MASLKREREERRGRERGEGGGEREREGGRRGEGGGERERSKGGHMYLVIITAWKVTYTAQ